MEAFGYVSALHSSEPDSLHLNIVLCAHNIAQYARNQKPPGTYAPLPTQRAQRQIPSQANPKRSYLAEKDVFNRLVPFWQLQLYFSQNGRPDFYAEVMEAMRCRPDAGSGKDSIRNQFEFAAICCAVGKLDLTDFFDKWGFFWVGNLAVNDYGKYDHTITQQMVDEVRSHIAQKQYSKPAADITLTQE
ncbi:MAG TPA: M60 family metallopeptidase [Candidatus Sulfotelmatobacter sp.]|nr:M60 family metallopeptidase [Candidatus Sulfotelmatobacter sp.]